MVSIAKREAGERYRHTPKGIAVGRASSRRYRQTPEGREYCLDYQRRSRQIPEVAEAHREEVRIWGQTPAGKACEIRHRHSRRRWSTNPDLYAVRVELLHILRESCSICGTPYERSHQIDHIIALCNGGTDDWDNFQPACLKCHIEKTKQDVRSYRGVNHDSR